MLNVCLAFWKSEPQYAYRRYAYKKNMQFMKFRMIYSWNAVIAMIFIISLKIGVVDLQHFQ